MTPKTTAVEPTDITKPFRTAIPVGVVVRDLDQQQFYYGEPARFRTRQAFADLGTVELELIQPLEGKSIWSDFLAERGPGIHHIRFNVPDHAALSAYLKDKGIGKTQEGAGLREGSYWVNYDTEKLIGFVIEILQPAVGSDGLTPGVQRHENP